MEGKTPKIFISYSWAVSEPVLELAKRLMADGVEVIFDKWDLKEGQDKYAFMEQCVTNPEIDKVLLICDKSYMDKADSRAGGVGDETVIISPEVYGKVNQEKFLPVIFEVDENNKPYLPTYLKARIYFDLSTEDQYESEYEKLLRNLHNKPLYNKPELGKRPDWLENDTVDLSQVRGLIKQIKGYKGDNKTKADFLLLNATDSFLTVLLEFKIPQMNAEALIAKINDMKPLRDLYVDFILAAISNDLLSIDLITSFFEKAYNKTHDAAVLGLTNYGQESDFEQYDFFIRESFIATAAILFHYRKYAELREILQRTYFLRSDYYEEAPLIPHNYCVFKKYISIIEKHCKHKCDDPKHCSVTAYMLIQREKKPLLTSQSLSRADVLLYQLSKVVINISKPNEKYWFPTAYCYLKGRNSMWTQLRSEEYCRKIFPLFGVTTIAELKEVIANCEPDNTIRCDGCSKMAPSILSSINIEDVGVLP